MKKNMNMYLNVLMLVLVFLVLYVSIADNANLRTLGKRLTSGQINTVLILLIITLILTENIQMGLLITIIYLVLLVRFNSKENKEHFDSDYGPNPLDCNTYGESASKTGIAQYPLNP